MKKLSIIFALLLMINVNLFAKDEVYGEGVKLNVPTKVSDILENPKSFEGERVLIEGKINSVCSFRGCWMWIKSDKKEQELKVKVLDQSMAFPISAIGKMVRAEGIIQNVKKADVEYNKKKAEKAKNNPKKANENHAKMKKSTSNIKKKPIPEYRMHILGAVIIG